MFFIKLKEMNYGKFIKLDNLGCFTDAQHVLFSKIAKPSALCGVLIPDDLNDLTMGDIADIGDNPDVVTLVSVVLDYPRERVAKKIMTESAEAVIGFLNFARKEMDRMAALFAQCAVQPTPEEERAGIGALDFGLFGTIDWYARRMGITDHDEVLGVKWPIVWKCGMMDAKRMMFERKLNEIYSKKTK